MRLLTERGMRGAVDLYVDIELLSKCHWNPTKLGREGREGERERERRGRKGGREGAREGGREEGGRERKRTVR